MIRVLIAEDVTLFRSGLVAILEAESNIEVIAAVDCSQKIVPAATEYRPDVALIDMDLLDKDTLSVVCELRRELPECALVVLASHRRHGDLRRAAAAGAAGVVLKDTSAAELAGSIRRVASGEHVIDAELAFAELTAARSPLTPRELEVLRLAAEGASAAQIAETLVLTTGTVRNHLSRVNCKIGARNRVHAIRLAEEAGWL